jgi:hypothetical protein
MPSTLCLPYTIPIPQYNILKYTLYVFSTAHTQILNRKLSNPIIMWIIPNAEQWYCIVL